MFPADVGFGPRAFGLVTQAPNFLQGSRLLPQLCPSTLLRASRAKSRDGGRRMAERAAHLVDHMFPPVGVRQWVLSFPHRLRYLLAWDHALCRAVVFVQRFGAALNLNVHFHALVLDGVFAENAGGGVAFRALPPPRDDDVAAALTVVRRRVPVSPRRAPDRPRGDPAMGARRSVACGDGPDTAYRPYRRRPGNGRAPQRVLHTPSPPAASCRRPGNNQLGICASGRETRAIRAVRQSFGTARDEWGGVEPEASPCIACRPQRAPAPQEHSPGAPARTGRATRVGNPIQFVAAP